MKVICFHLPQYHCFNENNQWWGDGFTEWVNVNRVEREYFSEQEILKPSNETGFYSLLDKKVRAAQAILAKENGIHGFCYHHYWFNGKLLMERPLELILEDGEPNLPFMLHWANEPWTRSWDGYEKEILQPQSYGDRAEWGAHFRWMLKFFSHPNYIKIGNRPALALYRIRQIKDYKDRIEYYNELAREAGFQGVYIMMMLSHFDDAQYGDDLDSVVDALIQYEPNNSSKRFFHEIKETSGSFTKMDIKKAWSYVEDFCPPRKRTYLGTFPNWDNTPRRLERATAYYGSTPAAFEKHLSKMVAKNMRLGNEFFFVNAWNEWAEGCAVEPSEQHEAAYLMAIKKVLVEIAAERCI